MELGANNLRLYQLPTLLVDVRIAVLASLGFLKLADLHVTLPLLAAIYLAPLTQLMSLNAVLWLYGMTQSLKSTLTMLLLCHFGQGFVDGTKYFAPADWISSSTDLEHSMFVTKDAPLVIDDFAPQASEDETRRLNQKAQLVIRSVGNRSAPGRI